MGRNSKKAESQKKTFAPQLLNKDYVRKESYVNV